MSVRAIRGHLEELYGIEVSPDLISAVTDAVLAEVAEWQSRPLEACHPLVKERTAAKNRAKQLTLPLLKKLYAARLKQIAGQIKAVEAAIRARLQVDPELARRLASWSAFPACRNSPPLRS